MILAFLMTLPCVDHGLVEGDVVGLPLERWLADVHGRDDLFVDRAAIVVRSLRPYESRTWSSWLPGRNTPLLPRPCPRAFRHVRHVEFEMELEVAEPFCHDIALPTVKSHR